MERLQEMIRQEMLIRRLTSQEAVAADIEKLHKCGEVETGVTQTTISRIMRGEMSHGREYHPSRATCRALAVWLHRSAREVIDAAGLFGDVAEAEVAESDDADALPVEPELDATRQRVVDLLPRVSESDLEWVADFLTTRARTDEGATESETKHEAAREAVTERFDL